MLLVVIIVIVLLRNLEHSRVGRAWMALREDEVAAAATGINTTSTKLLAFAIGASVSGLAGAFYGSIVTIVSPDDFSFSVSVSILSIIVLGGIGNITGVIVGSFVLTFVIFWVLQNLNEWSATLGQTINVPSLGNIDFSQYTYMIYGVALILMMLLRPGGLMPKSRAPDRADVGRRGGIAGRRAGNRLMALIEVESLVKRFGGLLAVNDVSFVIDTGEIVSMIGPNGAGKTTAFNCVTGLYPITSGAVRFDGHSITGQPPHRITRLGIARTFQNIRLFSYMTALDNVMVGAHWWMTARVWDSVVKSPRARADEKRVEARRGTCSTSWASRATPAPTRASCPTACSAASRSPERWPRSRASCSSTNRPPASTLRRRRS